AFSDGAEPPPMHAAVVRRQGADFTLIAYSRMVEVALAAADTLAGEGIDCEVVDLRSLRPMDLVALQDSVAKTHRALIVEEDCRFAGAGAEIAAVLNEVAFFELEAPVARVAGADVPTPYNGELEAASIPRSADVAEAVREWSVS
ncbi:MAG: transketolase C-terminal domain-containing protein, partial [Thiohalorhabdaceae bacterium]